MSFFLDHSSQIITLMMLVFGLVATWTRMNMKLNDVEDRVMENRLATEKSFVGLKSAFDKDFSLLRHEHELCLIGTREHLADMNLHTADAERTFRLEWRKNVMDRLDRIETLLLDLKNNGIRGKHG